MDQSSRYDVERARRYKKWWKRQKGPVQGDLIKVLPETWRSGSAPGSSGGDSALRAAK